MATVTSEVCIIAEGTVLEGDIVTETSLRLEGTVLGNVQCKGRFVLSNTAILKGNVNARSIISDGRIEGDIYVSDTIHLKSSSHVLGSVSYNEIVIDKGAVINGTLSNIQANSTVQNEE